MDLRIIEGVAAVAEAGCQSQSCPTSDEALLPEAVRRRIADHPCYSETAHRHHARMHLAVAPGCNIQCNYCNRKFDCANESRPGVVSEVLRPEEAVRKARAVASRIPNLSVVGIAGPGDPLANPVRTFTTLRRIKAELPHVHLCLSTNGLALGAHIEEIVALGIDHVTVTVNAIDPDIGARIYPWVVWEGRRIVGRAAAEILIREQLRGIEALVRHGILVKINSVMIPGVNADHLPAVSRAMRERGAFLHNIMPLIAKPEHGTVFGLSGQREPTPGELQGLRTICGGDMRMMRHCRQCRADAVGMLGADRGQEFTMDKVAAMEPRVLIAVASRDGRLVDQHFGHARAFRLFEVSDSGIRDAGRRDIAPYCSGPADCDEDDDRMERVLAALSGCVAVLCARIGREPWQSLEAAGIRPLVDHAWQPVPEALEAAHRTLGGR